MLLAILATVVIVRRGPSRLIVTSSVSDAPALQPGVPAGVGVSPETVSDVRGETLARLAYGQAWSGSLPPAMEAFRAWTERYRGAPSLAARLALESEGVSLAQARRPEMRKMIVTDPRQALAVTVPAVVRQELPAPVLAQLETRHAGRGEYALLATVPQPGVPLEGPSLQRIVYLGGETFTARPYGRREAQLTKEGASLHGIALDGQFALHESPVRVLEPGERLAAVASAGGRCAACTLALEESADLMVANVAALEFAEADGRLWRVHAAELATLERRAQQTEDLAGPRVPAFDPSTPERAADAALPHAVGTKEVLVIRTEFSDFPGDPVSQTTAQNLMESSVKSILEDMSYGQTSIVTTVSSQLYRLPRTAASYATANDNSGLHADARTAAAANYTLANYDRIVVVFPLINTTRVPGARITYAGLASIGGTNSWINGPSAFNFATITHELGHNFGLSHSNLWRVRDANPTSAAGTTLEYGDPFDMMGSTSATGVTRDTRHHYGMWGKNKLGWLPDSAVTTVATSGTYRIHRFDHRNAPRDKPLALRIFRDGVRWYWVGLRQNFATGTPSIGGAHVTWGYNQPLQSQLLDLTTPGVGANDAGLNLGATFVDPAYGVSIKPLARGGSAPEEWLDVEITVPATPPNVVAAWGRLGSSFFDTETGDDILPIPETNVPMDLARVQAIAAGDEHAIALRRDGTVVAWGDHVAGQIAVPSDLGPVASVAAGADFSGVVLRDGTVRVWGAETGNVTTVPPGLNNVKQLALGRNHAVALKTDGSVVAWGANNLGQINVPAGLGEVTAIAAGAEHTVALKHDGTVAAWGSANARVGFPAGLNKVKAISAFGALNGGQFAVALKHDGTVVAWGANNEGQATVPVGLTDVVGIAAGAFHTVLLKRDGTVTTFGSTAFGRAMVPPSMPRAVAVAASWAASFALVGSDFAVLTQPQPEVVAVGGSATLRVEASGSGAQRCQWRKDGVAIPGATANTYTIAQATASHAGAYDVVITEGADTLTSTRATLTVETSTTQISRIANLSIRTNAGTGADTLIVGFAVSGAGTKPLLVRGVGPTLQTFGVAGAHGDPRVDLYSSAQRRLQGNDDWPAVDAALFDRLGAFRLTAGSYDASLNLPDLVPGTYSAQIAGTGNATGIVLAEIYDATPGAVFTVARPRLVNVSARTRSGTGAEVLIAGFVIAGPTPKRVLIRAIGPTLGVFGVTGVLADPRLDLYRGETHIGENDNWGGTEALRSAFSSVGAFALDNAARDAALVVSLEPGSYTAQISGVGGTTGVALVEIYEVP